MSTQPPKKQPMSRRRFMQSSAVASMGLLLAACGAESPTEAVIPVASRPTTAPLSPTVAESSVVATNMPSAPTDAPRLKPTPQCSDHDETPAQTAGPFYTPNTPERTNLREVGLNGTPLLLTGQVLTPTCEPIVGAILDFWHADDRGAYDNEGYRLRGHQFTAADGTYRLETIVPGLYPGRTRHIHVIVQGANTDLLTTQLYFPNEPDNQRDGIYSPQLEMTTSDTAEGKVATFDFVLA